MKTTSPKTPMPDSDDFNELLESTFDDARGELLGTLFYLVGNMEDARDALQESFLKCWRKREQLSNISNMRAFVFRVALNTGRDFRKTAWNRRRESIAEDAVMVSTTKGPDAGLMQDEEVRTLRLAVLELRPEEQEIFLLRQNGEMTYEQIAESMSLPIGTVKTRMRSAIRQLRLSVGGQA